MLGLIELHLLSLPCRINVPTQPFAFFFLPYIVEPSASFSVLYFTQLS